MLHSKSQLLTEGFNETINSILTSSSTGIYGEETRVNYSIRPFEQKDMSFLWEMLYQSIHVPEGQQPPSRDILKHPSIEKYLKDWGNPNDHALIAADNDSNPIGAVWIRRFDRDNPGYGFVDEYTPELGMAIMPQFRGRGIGRQLLLAMSELSRSLGLVALTLSVDPSNTPALRLYEKNGYVMVHQDDGGSWTMKSLL
jgi:ribosomal protein S18 acetylase RimI-like enzyme